jgi:cystathionine beta-lyase/cystathionine gamma-synthase
MRTPIKPKEISHILNELGEDRTKYYNAAAVPLMQNSIFTFDTIEDLRCGLNAQDSTCVYSRGKNPTNSILQAKLAALERTEECLLFASGMAAISAAVMSEVRSGDHVICMDQTYYPAVKLLKQYLVRFNIEYTLVDGKDLAAIKAAIQPNTRVIYLESPTSFLFDLQDLEAVANIAKEHGITTIIDNTFATSLYQRPAELGIDIVIHSATKYLGGCSDLMGGALCTDSVRCKNIFDGEFMTLGGIMPPFHAWLILRSLRTLPIRLKQHGSTAQYLCERLEKHPKIERVYYPFLKSHPQYELAKKQMEGATGLFSFDVKADDEQGIHRFCNSLKCFMRAISWGGYESLVVPFCVNIPEGTDYDNPAFSWKLVRVHAGLEDPNYLLEDIEQALEKV